MRLLFSTFNFVGF